MLLLNTALAEARAGRGQAVFVSGAAGIGKSRLVYAAAAEAAGRGMVTLRARASTIGACAPLRALAEALLTESRNTGVLLDEAVPYPAVLGWLEDSGRSGRSPVVLAESLVQLPARAASTCGSLLILEDVHEADLETLAVIEYLVDNLAGQRVALVCTQRPDAGRAAEIMERAEYHDHTIRIDLSGLGPRALGELAADCLRDRGEAAVDPALIDQLWRISAGNPSLARRLLRDWRDEGTVILGPAGWGVAEGPGLEVPHALACATSARIKRLDRRSSWLLQAAAVVGTRFPLSLLGQLVNADHVSLSDFARRAVDTGLLVADPGQLGWYCFAHPLSNRAAQARMTRAGRAELAAVAAEAIERQLATLPWDWARRAADLRELAGQPPSAHHLPFATSAKRTGPQGAWARADAKPSRVTAGSQEPAEPHFDAHVRIGAAKWLADGDTSVLERIRQRAVDADVQSGGVGMVLRLDAVLRSEFTRFAALGTAAFADPAGPQVQHLGCSPLALRAIAAAHRGRRAEMETLTAQLRDDPAGHGASMPLVHGLGRAFSSLLDVDPVGARRELHGAEAVGGSKPSDCLLGPLDGRYGLALLLDVLAGTRGWPDYREIAGLPAARLRWNRHFTELAQAVLLGRDGSGELASTALNRAADAGAIYPTAKQLGMLLVAAEAHARGWGQPVQWLRVAEDHFFRMGHAAAVSSCRRLQRDMGGRLRQRRHGTGQIPERLRIAGVTARELEVLRLLAASGTNRHIASELYLSPRTVERHVANLLAKTGQANRAGLVGYYLDCRAAG